MRKVRTDSKRKRNTWNKLPLTLEDLAGAVERARDRLAEKAKVAQDAASGAATGRFDPPELWMCTPCGTRLGRC